MDFDSVYESTLTAQDCFDRCYSSLSKAASGFSEALHLIETTALGSAIVSKVDQHIKDAANWLKHLYEHLEDDVLVIAVVGVEVDALNTVDIPHVVQTLRHVFKHELYDSDDREATHRSCVQFKQVIDSLRIVIGNYQRKMHINDPTLEIIEVDLLTS